VSASISKDGDEWIWAEKLFGDDAGIHACYYTSNMLETSATFMMRCGEQERDEVKRRKGRRKEQGEIAEVKTYEQESAH
jgi:hypothetical protein